MGLLDDAEKLAGAAAAFEGMKKLDPNANLAEEAAAAVAGFAGTGAVADKLKNVNASGMMEELKEKVQEKVQEVEGHKKS